MGRGGGFLGGFRHDRSIDRRTDLGPEPQGGDRRAMRRMGRPEDIADAVPASDRASWITGQILPVTGSPLA
jgi:NAD(P)-dependent dehydrogenase (short-subunit alcohol dehydrogenase family)